MRISNYPSRRLNSLNHVVLKHPTWKQKNLRYQIFKISRANRKTAFALPTNFDSFSLSKSPSSWKFTIVYQSVYTLCAENENKFAIRALEMFIGTGEEAIVPNRFQPEISIRAISNVNPVLTQCPGEGRLLTTSWLLPPLLATLSRPRFIKRIESVFWRRLVSNNLNA